MLLNRTITEKQYFLQLPGIMQKYLSNPQFRATELYSANRDFAYSIVIKGGSRYYHDLWIKLHFLQENMPERKYSILHNFDVSMVHLFLQEYHIFLLRGCS